VRTRIEIVERERERCRGRKAQVFNRFDSILSLNVHWSKRLAITPHRMGPQIGSATEETSAQRAGELRWLVAAIVAPVPSQIAVQVVRATAAVAFIPAQLVRHHLLSRLA